MTALWEAMFDPRRSPGGARLRSLLERAVAVPGGEGPGLAVQRLPRAAWPLLAGAVARLCAAGGRPLLVLTPGPDRFLAELRPWLAGTPPGHLFAEVTVSFLDRPPAFDEAVGRRLDALAALASGEPCAVVSSRRAAQRVTVSPLELRETSVTLRPGLAADPQDLARRLVDMGYSREPLVEAPGQFSVRGGILDVFPPAGRSPVRAEWLGQEVETLRLFDPVNQRSVMAVPRVTLRPGRELLLGPARGVAAAALLRSEGGLEGLRGDVRADWEADLESLASGASFPGVELFARYLDTAGSSLYDHLPEAAVVLDFDPERQTADVLQMEAEVEMLAAAEARDGELPRGFRAPMVESSRLAAPDRPRVRVSAGEAPEPEGPVPAAGAPLDLGWADVEPVVSRPRALAGAAGAAGRGQAPEDGEGPASMLVLASEQALRVEALLQEAGAGPSAGAVDLDLDLELRPGLFTADLDVDAGCRHDGLGFCLLTDRELFGRARRPAAPPGRATRAGVRDSSLMLEFQADELVVHVDHGVARFKGMRLIEADGADREYLELEYADGDRLFVPVESMDRVQKYLGGGEGEPSLHRLGTGDWERARR
ncbi:MAG: CarD family transcriptional regulator, partial [Candidatus Dormibacterales bacterium]